MNHSLKCSISILVFFILGAFGATYNGTYHPPCGKSYISDDVGTIQSPNYPMPFFSQINCEWAINCPQKSLLKIQVTDLDLDDDCSQHWLSIPFEGGRGYHILCGKHFPKDPIIVLETITYIKYYSSESQKRSRGFSIAYYLQDLKCNTSDFQCRSGDCVKNSSRCDGVRDCIDGFDEEGCPVKAWCGKGTIPCTSTPTHCYSITDHLCDGRVFCPHGEDEVGCEKECPNKIACASGDGCYLPSQRCNGIRNCRDNSDETGCVNLGCAPLEFICTNLMCVSSSSLCDGVDDCGDMSDEEHCWRPSMVVISTVGIIACGTVFCMMVVLLYRYYTLRLRSTAVTFVGIESEGHTDYGFICQEPPPSYAAALAEYHPPPPSRRHRRMIRRPLRRESRPADAPPAKRLLPPRYVANSADTTPESTPPPSPSPLPSPVREIPVITRVEDFLLA